MIAAAAAAGLGSGKAAAMATVTRVTKAKSCMVLGCVRMYLAPMCFGSFADGL